MCEMALNIPNKNFLSLQLNSKYNNKKKYSHYDNVTYNINKSEDDSHLPLSVLELNRSSEDNKQLQLVRYDSPLPGTTKDLTVGSLIEISNDVSQEPLYGVIRWMGVNTASKQVLVGVELEEEHSHLPLTLTDGVHNGQRFFQCADNRGLFVPLSQCHKDSRFICGNITSTNHISDKMFGKEVSVSTLYSN